MLKRNNSLGRHMQAAWAICLLVTVNFGGNNVWKTLGLLQPTASQAQSSCAGRVVCDCSRREGSLRDNQGTSNDRDTRPNDQGLPAQH